MSAAQVIDIEAFRQKRLEQQKPAAGSSAMSPSPYPANWVWVWMWPTAVVR